jgi:hypothetical protein
VRIFNLRIFNLVPHVRRTKFAIDMVAKAATA